ncbi:uncharacterized protein G2W53_003888 [Senna tora]|uniref:Uncharacterized protein n=1 Tax=Senna tora TaxID=362788 RepID=A0A835CIU2_9FABA|nr:uncharacterized protein G2W53_003888 [Senna tora]
MLILKEIVLRLQDVISHVSYFLPHDSYLMYYSIGTWAYLGWHGMTGSKFCYPSFFIFFSTKAFLSDLIICSSSTLSSSTRIWYTMQVKLLRMLLTVDIGRMLFSTKYTQFLALLAILCYWQIPCFTDELWYHLWDMYSSNHWLHAPSQACFNRLSRNSGQLFPQSVAHPGLATEEGSLRFSGYGHNAIANRKRI